MPASNRFLLIGGTAFEPNTPVLHLEDVSAIPFLVDIAGVKEYQHRARLRAKSGDLYATMTPGDPRYEQVLPGAARSGRGGAARCSL